MLFCPACINSLHQQPISEKLDPSIRKFVVKERVLFMHNVVDKLQRDAIGKKANQSRSDNKELSDNDFIVTTHSRLFSDSNSTGRISN